MNGASLDRDRLAAVLGRLGSDFDGEILAAARQAERIRREVGLTWREVLAPVLLPAPTRHQHLESVEDALSYCAEYADLLTTWERNFVNSLGRQRKPISAKQATILDQVVDKVRTAEARAAA